MTTLTFSCRRHHPAMTATLVLLFWLVAAVAVTAAHVRIEPRWPGFGAATAIAALLLTAFAYTRLVAREAGITHALGVGIAWLVFSIAAEMAFSAALGHNWFSLLGTPAHPLLRNLDLFAWIFAPAFFARGE